MNWRETLRTGLEAVRSHRLRSVLAMPGILIGIAAVIRTAGFGEGAPAQIRAQINALGTKPADHHPAGARRAPAG